MSVTLLRPYAGLATGAVYTGPDTTEASLIAQGLATAYLATAQSALAGAPLGPLTQGGNVWYGPQSGFGTPTYLQGNSILPNIALGSAALTGYETNGAAQVAGTWNYSEIYVPYLNTWKGAGVLNGTTVGTNTYVLALFGTNGTTLANTLATGTATANASVMQNVAFVNPIALVPGRYFIGVQLNGATDTVRHLLSANGSNVICGTQTGAAGTIPASITTVSTTFTTAVAPICQLYTV